MSNAQNEAPCYVVLGASGGVGSALTRILTGGGARVLAASRPSDRLDRLAEETRADLHALDATSFQQVEDCIGRASDEWGSLDGVANCVGSLLLKPAHQTDEEEWETTLRTNLGSAFAAVRSGARAMMRSGGSIVLVSSAAARLGFGSHEAIAAAKAGIEGLCRAAAASYGRYGVRVNAVAPGLVDTRLTSQLTGSDAARKISQQMHILGRLGDPKDVAQAMAWLLAPGQSWITGQVLAVDGGLGSVRPRPKA